MSGTKKNFRGIGSLKKSKSDTFIFHLSDFMVERHDKIREQTQSTSQDLS